MSKSHYCVMMSLQWLLSVLIIAGAFERPLSSGTNHNQIEKRSIRTKRSMTVSEWHVQGIFRYYDQESTESLSLENFKKLLSDIGLASMNGHNHGHEHDHHGHDHDHGDDHSDHNHEGHENGDHDHGNDHSDHDHEGHENGDHDHGDDHSDHDHDYDYDDHDHQGHDHDDHDHQGHDHDDHDHQGHDHDDHDHQGHDHDDHDHQGHDHDDHDHHNHRRRRALNDRSNDNETESGDDLKCYKTKVLLESFGLADKKYLSVYEFETLCPALIDLQLSKVCEGHDEHDHAHGDNKEDGHSTAAAWGYMFVCVTIISMCAVWGILFIPRKSRSIYQKIIQGLMALAAGSMAGDALLHLLPHAMMPPHDHSAHGHEGHDHHGHDHDEDSHADEHTTALLKGLVAVVGLYSFFFMERFFTIWTARSMKAGDASDAQKDATMRMLHSHGEPEPLDDDVKIITPSPSGNTDVTEVSPLDEKSHHWPHPRINGNCNTIEAASESTEGDGAQGFCPVLKPLALMIILGDLFHNLCDGLAIGAAFSSNVTVGFSTSIAVFCHELPHEIGDFAVLIKTGLSKKNAVFLNFVSALSCYLGAVIGMFLGSVGDAPMWIFAGVGGMFLYIALVDLVPEMTHVYTSPGGSWKTFLPIHALGLFLGTVLMLILGFYEHDIQMALG